MTTSPSPAAQISGGTWTIDRTHSLIEFAARHFDIAYVKGRFRDFSGTVQINPQDLLQSSIELTIDATSVESQAVGMREDLIKGDEMLETSKYPQITFKSTRIQQQDLTHYVVTGDLSLHGVTQEVQVPLELGGVVNTRMGPRAGFSGQLTLSMDAFQIPFTREFEPGRRVVGDQIRVELQIELAPAAAS